MTLPTIETVITTLPFGADDIMRAYKGAPNKCMCGCSGTYFNRLIDDIQIQHIYQKMFRNAHLGVRTHYDPVDEVHIYVIIVGDTQYVIYASK